MAIAVARQWRDYEGGMRLLLALAFAAVGISGPPGTPDNTIPPGTPEQFVRSIITSSVSTAFSDENFALIDEMVKSYRQTKAKTPAGSWKSGLVYDAFEFPGAAEEHLIQRDERIASTWIAKFPQSSTAHIVSADLLIQHAYFFRGEGLASSVPPQAWPKFYAYLTRARSSLEACKRICSADPDWYTFMLQVAKLQGWPKKTFLRLFNEGAGKFPDYQRIYFQGAEYFSPLWNGNDEALDAFVQDAIGRTSALEGTIFYARIYGQMAHGAGANCECAHIVGPRMYNALEELNRKYPDPWNTNEFAWEACMHGDKIALKMQLPKIKGGPPNFEIWGSPEILNICKKWATDKFSPPNISPFALPPHPTAKQTTTL